MQQSAVLGGMGHRSNMCSCDYPIHSPLGPSAEGRIHRSSTQAASVRVLSDPDDTAGEPSTSQADFTLHVCLDGRGYSVDKHQVRIPNRYSIPCKPPWFDRSSPYATLAVFHPRRLSYAAARGRCDDDMAEGEMLRARGPGTT